MGNLVEMMVFGVRRPVGMEVSFAYLMAASLREFIRPRLRDLVKAFGAFWYPEYYFLAEWAEERAGRLVIGWLKSSRCCWSRW